MSEEIDDQAEFFDMMRNNHKCMGENCSICNFLKPDPEEHFLESYRVIILDYSKNEQFNKFKNDKKRF